MHNITCAKEDYLRAILILDEGFGAHSVDVARMLDVSRASVSKMMNTLEEQGYINKEKYSLVQLTDKGKEIAFSVKKKYDLLKDFFHMHLGIDEKLAQKEACAVEHCISLNTLEKIYNKLNLVIEE